MIIIINSNDKLSLHKIKKSAGIFVKFKNLTVQKILQLLIDHN